jgi:hypothetical protein
LKALGVGIGVGIGNEPRVGVAGVGALNQTETVSADEVTVNVESTYC